VLVDLALLPHVPVATTDEPFSLVEPRRLNRRGIGITNLHVLASALFNKSISIWTKDQRLGDLADEFGLRVANFSHLRLRVKTRWVGLCSLCSYCAGF
jgi:hypothetical protein